MPRHLSQFLIVILAALLLSSCSSGKKPAPAPVNAQTLIADLITSTDESVRSAAAQQLGALRDRAAVQPLIDALKDDAVGVRAAAALALGELQDPRAVDPLCQSLKNDPRAAKIAAARALAKLKDPRAIEPLVAALRDIGDDAGSALVSFDEVAVASLIKGLQDSDTRIPAIQTLSNIGEPAVGPLIEILRRDPNKAVRLAAASALADIDDPQASAALNDVLKTGNLEIVAAVYRTLIRRGTPGTEHLLIQALQTYGNAPMAKDFAYSENPLLKTAATDWGGRNRFVVAGGPVRAETPVWGKHETSARELALFHFDNLLDSASGAHPAQAAGTTFVPGKWGQALAVDVKGALAYPVAGNLNFEKGTVEAWIALRFEGTNAIYKQRNQALVIYVAPRGDQFIFAHTADNNSFYAGTYIDKKFAGVGGGNMTGWKAGDWHHIAFTYLANGAKRLFLDGAQITEFTGPMPLPQSGTSTFFVDSDPYGNSSAFLVDELRIFDDAKTPLAIQSDANRVKPAEEKRPINAKP